MKSGGRAIACYRLLVTAVFLLPAACTSSEDDFSQSPGFNAIRAGLRSTPPNAAEQSLLARHKPVLHVAAGEEGLIDFYRDYIGSGALVDSQKQIRQNPDAAALNALRYDSAAVFTHRPATQSPQPAVFGSVYYATLTLTADDARAVTFLGYHFVFRRSGLPAGISPLKQALAGLFAAPGDWHQLDHYTAAFVALYEGQPFAVLLQQHNYMRTYFMEEDPAFAEGRVVLDAAISSNELYPHRTAPRRWRTAGFMNAPAAAYLTGVSDDGGWNAAVDITAGGRSAAYTLAFLPPDDAFYVFTGRLGENRWLPGRDGPPGAIYRTLPSLWPLEKSLYVFYWGDDDGGYAQLVKQGFSEKQLPKYLARFAEKFYKIIK